MLMIHAGGDDDDIRNVTSHQRSQWKCQLHLLNWLVLLTCLLRSLLCVLHCALLFYGIFCALVVVVAPGSSYLLWSLFIASSRLTTTLVYSQYLPGILANFISTTVLGLVDFIKSLCDVFIRVFPPFPSRQSRQQTTFQLVLIFIMRHGKTRKKGERK